jgi:hypothetical protein
VNRVCVFGRTLKMMMLLLVILTGCEKRSEPYSIRRELRDGVEHWVYQAPNGVTMITSKDHVDVVVGTDRGLSFHLNPTNRTPSGLLLETSGSDGKAGQWVRDADFDGLPDSRRLKGGGKEVYFEGRWHMYKALGDSISIELEGVVVVLGFDGGKWIRVGPGTERGIR